MSKFCPNCGAPIESGSNVCHNCGSIVGPENGGQYQSNQNSQYGPYGSNQNGHYDQFGNNQNNQFNAYGNNQYQQGGQFQQNYQNGYNQFQNYGYQPLPARSKVAAGILFILFGDIGVGNFYMGQIGLGIVDLLFCWTGIPAIVNFIRGIIVLCSSDESFCQKYNCRLG